MVEFELLCLIGLSRFATQTILLFGMFLYHIPTYRFVELPGLKKPNSKVPSLETKVLPSSIRD
jgi:hypothetical protein